MFLILIGDLKSVPTRTMDKETEILIIRSPKNNVHIGPIFIAFTKLRVIRITDSNVPAIGQNSFWGVKSLRILGNFLTIKLMH